MIELIPAIDLIDGNVSVFHKETTAQNASTTKTR